MHISTNSSCQSHMETEKDTHTHTHFDFQGGSLQLFRDSLRHTPWPELCEDNGGSSVINNSITPSLLCIASLLSCFSICACVCVTTDVRDWGLCRGLGQLQWSVRLTCCVCVWERKTHREDFPFSGCPLPYIFGPFLSVTLHLPIQIQNRQTAYFLTHSAALWHMWHLAFHFH